MCPELRKGAPSTRPASRPPGWLERISLLPTQQPTGCRCAAARCPVPAGTSFVKAFFRLANCSTLEAAACPVLRIIDYSNAAAVKSALAAWDDYFVAVFARNVLRRAVSQYQVGAAARAKGRCLRRLGVAAGRRGRRRQG